MEMSEVNGVKSPTQNAYMCDGVNLFLIFVEAKYEVQEETQYSKGKYAKENRRGWEVSN